MVQLEKFTEPALRMLLRVYCLLLHVRRRPCLHPVSRNAGACDQAMDEQSPGVGVSSSAREQLLPK